MKVVCLSQLYGRSFGWCTGHAAMLAAHSTACGSSTSSLTTTCDDDVHLSCGFEILMTKSSVVMASQNASGFDMYKSQYGVPSQSTVTSHGLQWRTKPHSVGHLVAILASLQLIGCFFA